MPPFSQIVELNASPDFHNLGGAKPSHFLQTVEMKQDKNGGPNHLAAWRRKRQLTLEALAEAVGTTASVISYLESGERGLSAKWLRRLAPALGTTPGMLLDHDPEQLDDDVIEMWSHAPLTQKRQIAEITKTITRSGTDG